MGQQDVLQTFAKIKTEINKIFLFFRPLSWKVTFFQESLSKGSKLTENKDRFSDLKNLEIFEHVLQVFGH